MQDESLEYEDDGDGVAFAEQSHMAYGETGWPFVVDNKGDSKVEW